MERYSVSENTLSKIKNLADDMRGYSRFIREETDDNYTLDLNGGTGKIINVYKDADVAIARTYVNAGSRWQDHWHAEWEVVIVVSGETVIIVDGVEKRLLPKQTYYILPNTIHGAYFPVDTFIIALTIPASDDFPGVKE